MSHLFWICYGRPWPGLPDKSICKRNSLTATLDPASRLGVGVIAFAWALFNIGVWLCHAFLDRKPFLANACPSDSILLWLRCHLLPDTLCRTCTCKVYRAGPLPPITM